MLTLVASAVEAAAPITFSGPEHLGNPTDSSITINVVPQASVFIYFEYATTSGGPYTATSPLLAPANEPHEIVLTGLTPNTRYFYRMRYAQTLNDTDYIARPEYTFHTARPPGSTYEFVVTSDCHINLALGVLAQWRTTLDLIAGEGADFMLDLGDTFAMDGVTTPAAADAAYLFQRDADRMGRASHSVPIFLVMGNHENEEGWNFDDANPQPIFGMRARKRYFPLPSPLTAPSFYSANSDPVEASDVAAGNSHLIGADQFREDYYAWEWGDALFVVFDPYQYTMQNPYGSFAGEGGDEIVGGDRWNWTMGVQQHTWLRDTLANSTAKYKFLFAHQMLGGTENYVRGGAVAARWFEWGGHTPGANNNDATAMWEFDTKRPATAGWINPVHQLMQQYGVQAFFHGHDHQFVHEERDGIVYQLVPSPSQNATNGFNLYTSSPYVVPGGNLSNSGYLRVTITPAHATVAYVKTTGANVGQVQYSYTIAPNVAPDFTITASTGANGSISPSGSVGVAAGANQSFTITPDAGYEVDDVLIDGVSVGPPTSYAFTNVAADHTIYATFAPAAPTSDVVPDGPASSATAAANSSSIAFAHTTGSGSDRLLLVGIAWNSGSNVRTISSVTLSHGPGTTVLPLTEVFNQPAASQPRNAAIYRLLAPPAGVSGTVTVTFSGAVSNGIVAGAANFAGVDQTTPLGTPAGANNGATTGTTPSVTLSGLNGNELVFDTVFQGGSGSQTLTPGADQTQLWTQFVSNTRAAASTEQAAGSTVTMSSTAASAALWAIAAVPIRPTPLVDLTMTVNGDGATAPAAGAHLYKANAVVEVAAIPAARNFFNHWTGAVANPTAISTAVLLDGDTTITANFVAAPPGAINYVGAAGAGSIKNSAVDDLVIDLTTGVEAGDTIILAYATATQPDLALTVSDSQGNTYAPAGAARSHEHGETRVFYSYIDHALADTDTITITQSVPVGGTAPESRAAVASVFRGLARHGLDQARGHPPFDAGIAAPATDPSVGPTNTTMQAHELVFGAVATNGPVADADGAWRHGFVAGPRAGTTGGAAASNWTISVGWQWVAATGDYSAAKTGAPLRQWAAVVATFKALDTDADGLPDPIEEATPELNPFDPADALLDFDGDGANNLAEHIAGTDRFDAGSVLKITIALVGDNAEITIPGPLVAAGRSYILEHTSTLGETWNQLDSFTPTPGEAGAPFTFVHAFSGNAAFYRIRVLPPTP